MGVVFQRRVGDSSVYACTGTAEAITKRAASANEMVCFLAFIVFLLD
jgi:hypothetical protein